MKTLADLVTPLRSAFKRYHTATEEKIEATLDLARLLYEARQAHPSDIAFGGWLAENDLDDLGKDDRAALLNIAQHPDLFRDVMASGRRSSVHHIWYDEMRGRVLQVERADPPTISDPDEAMSAPQSAEDSEEAVAATEDSDNEVTPPRPTPMTLRMSPLAKVPGGEGILGHLSNNNTRKTLGRLAKAGKHGREALALMVEAIECGAFGQATDAAVTTPNLRLLLPWAPVGYAQRFNLLDAGCRAQVPQDVLPVARDNRDVLRLNPDLLPEMVRAAAQARRAEVVKTQEVKAHREAVAAMPATEREVIVYGQTLWPVGPSAKWTYQDALEAAWCFRILVQNLARFLGTPDNFTMTVNMFLRWIPAREGWAEAVRRIGWAYAREPEGRCDIPPSPPNYGM